MEMKRKKIIFLVLLADSFLFVVAAVFLAFVLTKPLNIPKQGFVAMITMQSWIKLLPSTNS